ncbi:MAG: hypothetical protein LC797_10870 [Chloroflexi bacterium]|nr:hypothetical protein [Chloroflexota bacterium]
MRYMLIEHFFKDGDGIRVYRRFRDLIDFEVRPVRTSQQAAQVIEPRL